VRLRGSMRVVRGVGDFFLLPGVEGDYIKKTITKAKRVDEEVLIMSNGITTRAHVGDYVILELDGSVSVIRGDLFNRMYNETC